MLVDVWIFASGLNISIFIHKLLWWAFNAFKVISIIEKNPNKTLFLGYQ